MNKSSKKVIKVIFGIVCLFLIIGTFLILNKDNIAKEDVINQDTNSSINEPTTEKQKISGMSMFLIFLLLGILVFIVIWAQKRDISSWKKLSDEKVREKVLEILKEKHQYDLEKGSCAYYLSYYLAGNIKYPRAIIGWSLNSRSSEGNVQEDKNFIITMDVSRNNPEYDSEFLEGMSRQEASKYLAQRRIGEIGEYPEPIKQDKLFMSDVEQEALKELSKDKLKTRLEK